MSLRSPLNPGDTRKSDRNVGQGDHDDNNAPGENERRAMRQRLIEQRLAMPPDQHDRLSVKIRANLLAGFPDMARQRVAFYWPMKNEPELRPLMRELAERAAKGFAALLPVVEERGKALVFRQWTPDAVMASDALGLPVPDERAPVAAPEVMLIPVNAFDLSGYRLGYGGGFFDRTLAEYGARALAVGVGFELSRVPSIDPLPHDMKLNAVVTEAAAYRFG